MISCYLSGRRTPRAFAAAAAAALLLGATPARARPLLTARAAFSPVRASDPGCAFVLVENDGVARSVVLRGERRDPSSRERPADSVTLGLDLQPGARKQVLLPLPSSAVERATIVMEEDGEVLAIAAMELRWASREQPLLAALAPAPPTLVACSSRILDAALGEVSELPPNPDAWPHLDALAWDRPRSEALTPAVAAALRRHVVSGGRVVVGVGPEETDVFRRAGLSDLLPARPVRGEGLQVSLTELTADASVLPVEGALVARRGLGELVLVPHPLDDVAESSWPALLEVKPPEPLPATQGRVPRRVPTRWTHLLALPGLDAVEDLVPKPPWVTATTILVAFLLAAVPLDGLLTRRSLRRGRRSRFGLLRYPAIVLAATGASFAVAGGAAGGDLRTWRVDVVDLGPDGTGTGTTIVRVARGQGGLMRVDGGGASLISMSPIDEWGSLTRGASATRHAHADAASPLTTGTVECSPWEPVSFRTAWSPRDLPAFTLPADPCAPIVVPEADGAAASTCGRIVRRPRFARAGPLQAEGGDADPEIAELFGDSSLLASGEARVILAYRERLGPDLEVDGRSTDSGPTFTLVRYHAAESSPEPAP